ncbi:MAG TPA: helix-turn-helix domain-containing protein [Candidatus Acidoferrum sp.]|jgi:excisionase family DNA binding protein|nr:helix-turn-helix domain-containing protein [Candidatus Acidoferrum sp.]
MAQSELFFDERPARQNADVRLQPVRSVRSSQERGIRALALLLTVPEVAERLGCGRTFVYELISTGELETVRLGRLRRVPVTALDALIERLRGANDPR